MVKGRTLTATEMDEAPASTTMLYVYLAACNIVGDGMVSNMKILVDKNETTLT